MREQGFLSFLFAHGCCRFLLLVPGINDEKCRTLYVEKMKGLADSLFFTIPF